MKKFFVKAITLQVVASLIIVGLASLFFAVYKQ
jgi:hypothetical protein